MDVQYLWSKTLMLYIYISLVLTREYARADEIFFERNE